MSVKRIVFSHFIIGMAGLMWAGASANPPEAPSLPDDSTLTLQRQESFDTDPGWDGHNNRSTTPECQPVTQDFGYSASTSHAGGSPGEIGGYVRPAAEPAWYAKVVPNLTMADTLSASGTLNLADGGGHALIGFFNSGTADSWRTGNSITLRIYGRGDVFYAYIDYCTGRWRAGGAEIGIDFAAGDAVHPWSFTYHPAGAGGVGTISTSIGSKTVTLTLELGHRADGAEFNRFGILNVTKAYDGAGTIWLDNVSINGEQHAFDNNPNWDEFQNKRAYTTCIVRPRFDFGHSQTARAGGTAAGEFGGIVWRGDWRDPLKLAYCGDRLDELSLENPLRASGRISLVRAVSDGDTLFGWFHSDFSLQKGDNSDPSTPQDFLGFSVGGPSREGYQVNPLYRLHGGSEGGSAIGPYILPNGSSHQFSLLYDPQGAAGEGRITLQLDNETVGLDLPPGHKATGARFNRFGVISTQVDGLYEEIYYDDLEYTFGLQSRSHLTLPWEAAD